LECATYLGIRQKQDLIFGQRGKHGYEISCILHQFIRQTQFSSSLEAGPQLIQVDLIAAKMRSQISLNYKGNKAQNPNIYNPTYIENLKSMDMAYLGLEIIKRLHSGN